MNSVFQRISIRDYFAAQALAAFEEISVDSDMGRDFWYSSEDIAKRCYDVANAMLVERIKYWKKDKL